MTDDPSDFDLDQFEYVPATAGIALVRVSGTWPGGTEELGLPSLVVRTPFGDDRVEPLPDSSGETEGVWRAAFSLALHVLTSGSVSFLLDRGDGAEIELPAPVERGTPGGFDRVAAGRELGELRAASERLRNALRATEKRAQEQVSEAQVATRLATAELERVSEERATLEQRLEALVQEEGSARGAHGVLQAELAELRADRDRLREEVAATRKQAAEGARQAERHLRTAEEATEAASAGEAKLEAAARRLAEADARAQEAEKRAAVAAAVASETGDKRATVALEEARQEADDARELAAQLRGQIDALRVASAEAFELAEARADGAIAAARADLERELAEAHGDRSAERAAVEAALEAERERGADLERRLEALGESHRELERRHAELTGAHRSASEERERLTAKLEERAHELQRARAEGQGREELEQKLAAADRELARVTADSERRAADLKRRAMRAEREAAEASKARDRAIGEARRTGRRPAGAQRAARERPTRPPRRATPAPPASGAVVEPLGPSLAMRLEVARHEEAAARAEVERLRAEGIDGEEPAVEMVDAGAALERAAEEAARLEQQLAAARESVEQTARSQLKRSSRGALRDATAQLAGTLAEGEEVLHMAAGGARDGRRLVAATDRRLLVVEGSEAAPETVGYDEVESVQAARRGTLRVSTKRGEFQLEQVAGDLDGLVQHVNQKIWDAVHRAGEAMGSDDAPDEQASS